MRHLRLTHPDLDFWVDVRLREWDGKWPTTDVGSHELQGHSRRPCGHERGMR